MTRSCRFLLPLACAATLLAAPALAQYQPVPPPPAAQPTPPPAAQPPAPAQPPPPAYQPPPPAYQPPPPAYAQPPAYPPAQPAYAAQPPPPSSRVQLGAFTGWQVNGDVDGIYGKLKVEDAQSFGVSLWTTARPGTKIELLWIYSNMQAQYDSYTLTYPSSKKFGVETNYFQLGGVQSMRRGKIEPFAGGTLGAVWYAPDNIESQSGLTSYHAGDTWRFAITLGGGLNVFLSESLAIRGYARMLVPMYFNGGSMYVGTGGSGLAVNAGVPAISGDFGAALVFAK
jgi:opacity protein-like surface antigen